MRIFGYDIPVMFALIFWCLAWEIAGRVPWETMGRPDLDLVLPPISEVFVAMGELLPNGKFQAATWLTLESFTLGMGIAVLAGIPLGMLMGRIEAVDKLLGMWVNVFVSAPLTALVPVIMILFGLGQTTIVVTVVLFAVWIIVLDTYAGIKHVSPSLLEMARSFGASRFELYVKILILAALPEILAGVRLGLIRAVKGVVIGQLLVSIIGYGELFELYSRNFLMDRFWALTILLFAFAMLASELIGWAERKVEYYAGAR
ncbi:MAG: ABC transporter permease [Kiloniellaceae bacterium]